MNITLVSINAKYIHTNNAVRLLKANCSFPINILEYTIKDDVSSICNDIQHHQPDILGFSVYIWNIEIITTILSALHHLKSTIVLGGPEVSYDPRYFLNLKGVDIVVRGEGEQVFQQLITCIHNNQPYHSLDNIATYYNQKLYINPIREIPDLSTIKSPHYFTEDIKHIPNKIGYIESSRGCPYHCSYCLSSLEKTVRFFPIEKVQNTILYLMKHGVKTIKFLDRTFNANTHTLDLIQFIIDHHNNKTVFQFEITGDTLPIALIEYINTKAKKGMFRFEIGIQSTNDATNKLVDRMQNTTQLFNRINLIQQGHIIDLHLDLIAGLPEEDKTSFIRTFNDVFTLGAKELQLGFLKLLRGTKIRNEANRFQYRFDENAPYEIIENNVLSQKDITEIKQVEHMLELYHNKGYFGIHLKDYIIHQESPYHFFLRLAKHYETHQYPLHRYQLEDIYEHLLELLPAGIQYQVIQDYLERSRIKPHRFFQSTISNHDKQYVYTYLTSVTTIPIQKFYKHSILIKYDDEYFCAYYSDNNCHSYKVKAPK